MMIEAFFWKKDSLRRTIFDSMRKIAIIDHVGAKAGLDYYSSSLAMGMVSYGVNVILISNFSIKQPGVKCFSYFGLHQNNIFKKAFNFYNGFLFAGIRSRYEGAKEAIIHLFSFGYKDLIAVIILKLLGLKLHAIVHDVEGFEESDKERHDLTNYILEVNKQIHGNYAFEDRMVIQEHWLGQLAAQFHKWIYPAYKARFKKRYIDENLGAVEGRYVTVMNFLKSAPTLVVTIPLLKASLLLSLGRRKMIPRQAC